MASTRYLRWPAAPPQSEKPPPPAKIDTNSGVLLESGEAISIRIDRTLRTGGYAPTIDVRVYAKRIP